MRKINFLFVILLTAASLFSCSQDDTISSDATRFVSAKEAKQLNGKIPFTVENVTKALPIVLNHYRENRPEVAERFANYKVAPTHVYYKFMPVDSLQYATLMEQDQVLNLTTDPFEYNIEERTEDPADNEIPIFYVLVSVETQIPDVPHEAIAQLHFTDEDNLEDEESNYDEIEFKQNLMYEARRLPVT